MKLHKGTLKDIIIHSGMVFGLGSGFGVGYYEDASGIGSGNSGVYRREGAHYAFMELFGLEVLHETV